MFEQQVARIYQAMERKDLEAVMAAWAEDCVFEFPGHNLFSGRYEGKEAVRGFFQ